MDATAARLTRGQVGGMPAVAPDRPDRALIAQALTRRFANGRGVFDVSLQVRRGELVALTGASGAGKTTLLRMLAGIERPDQGMVAINGHPRVGARRGDTSVALIFQQPCLVGRATVAQNVLAGRLGHVSRWRGLLRQFDTHDWTCALECLERVGMLTHAADRTDQLSGGERQRVALARALVQQPVVVLADEPVASLDPDNARRVLSVLRRCADQGLTVITSLHQMALAREFAHRCMVMSEGRIDHSHS